MVETYDHQGKQSCMTINNYYSSGKLAITGTISPDFSVV